MLRRAAMLALVTLLAASGCAGGGPHEPARAGPPYATFEGTSFEPSAVAYDPVTERFLVFSDKDSTLYRYRLEGDRLALPRDERHRALNLPGGGIALKVEGATRRADGTFLAITAFDRPDPAFRRLIRFRFGPYGPIDAEALALPDAAISARLRAVDPSIAWWKVEGLATTAGDAGIVIGVRSVGLGHDKKRDVVWLLRLPRGPGGYSAPDRLLRLDVASVVGREEGASSLERDPRDGSYLLLTSWETEANGGGPAGQTIEGHGGHLFRLPGALVDPPPPPGTPPSDGGPAPPSTAPDPTPSACPPPLRAFAAKPEGLALMPDGRALIVFDDDTGWKGLFEGYDQSQGLFTVVDLSK